MRPLRLRALRLCTAARPPPPAVAAVYDAVKRLQGARSGASIRQALSKAQQAYIEAGAQDMANPRMASVLVKEYARRGALAQADELWLRMRRSGTPQLTSQLSTALIASFGELEAWHRTHEVLRAARAASLANTIVFNSFLHACSKRAKAAGGASGAEGWGWGRGTPPAAAAPGAAAAARSARAALHRMQLDGVAADAHSTGLAIAVFGHARQLEAARRVLAEAMQASPAAVDVVSYNALLHAAATNADASLALDLLEAMPAAGLSPDVRSFNTVLQALAAAQRVQRAEQQSGAALSVVLDVVAEAGHVREQLAAAGVAEDGVTRTCLLALYSDTPLAETLLSDLSAWQLQQHRHLPNRRWNPSPPRLGILGEADVLGRSAAALPAEDEPWLDGAAEGRETRALIDLRGCTRPSAVVALRCALDRAADAHACGRAAAGWHIVCSERAAQARHGARGGPPRPSHAPMHRTAREFLEESGIQYETHRDHSLRVRSAELNRAAGLLHSLRTRQAIMQSGLFRIGMAFAVVSALCVLPQLSRGMGS